MSTIQFNNNETILMITVNYVCNLEYDNYTENILRKILENEYDNINKQDNKGQTALMIAVKSGNIDLVKLLLEYNSDQNIFDNEGWTVQTYAIYNIEISKYRKILNLLIEKEYNNSCFGNISYYFCKCLIWSYKRY